MTIYEFRNHEYDKINGGRNSLTFAPTLKILPEPTYKITAKASNYPLNSIELSQLENTTIEEEILTYSIKEGENPDESINLYGVGIESFEDILKSISGAKHIASDNAKKTQPKIVFSVNCKNAGTIFGKILLTDWNNNTKIDTAELWTIFEEKPTEETLKKYNEIYNIFGLPQPSELQNCQVTKTKIEINQYLERLDGWTNAIHREDGLYCSILETDMMDLNLIEYDSTIPFEQLYEQTPYIFNDGEKSVFNRIPDNQGLYEDMTILHPIIGETFYISSVFEEYMDSINNSTA